MERGGKLAAARRERARCAAAPREQNEMVMVRGDVDVVLWGDDFTV